MTIQASRIRSCLVPLPVLAMCVALAGCNLDQGPGSAAATHLIPGRPPCTNSWCAQCGPCSGFHPTVWQSWQEGSMAVRGSPGETGIAPAQHLPKDGSGPALPAPSQPRPEAIPTPEAQKGGEPTTPGAIPPAQRDPFPATETPNAAPQIPHEDKGPPAAGRDAPPVQEKRPPPAGNTALPAQEKLPAKPPITPPISPPPSKDPTQPITANSTQPITANSMGRIIITSWDADPSLRFGEVQAKTGNETLPPPPEAFPATFFAHGRMPQSPSSDAGKRHDENNQNLPSPSQTSPR